MARDEQNGIFRMEVHSRVEFQSGSARTPEWNIYVELNGPYGASVPFLSLLVS